MIEDDDYEAMARAASDPRWISPLWIELYRIARGKLVLSIEPSDYVCCECHETMTRSEDFLEYQHDGCGGLVRVRAW